MKNIFLLLTLLSFSTAYTQTLTLSKNDFLPNEEIIVSFSGFAGNATDWIGLYQAGSTDDKFITWQYTAGKTSGTLKFTVQQPGSYEFRGFFNNSYVLQVTRAFRVVSSMDTGFKVWVRTEPCSGRFDWLSVAKERGGGGTGKGTNAYWLYNTYLPTPAGFKPCIYDGPDGCTFEEANALMEALRMHDKFFDLCCRDYSVWRHEGMSKNSVVLGDFSPGIGWSLLKGNLCCEEAEVLSGIIGACSGSRHCYSSDPAMASTDWDQHYDWAIKQSSAAISENFLKKINLLFNCPSVPDEYLYNAYADFSELIADYMPDAECFGGDKGASSDNREAHLAWAKSKSRSEMLSNLQWKIVSVLKCLDHAQQVALFADNSTVIGTTLEEIPNVTGDGGDGIVIKDDKGIVIKKDDGKVIKDDGKPVENPCVSAETSAFSQMTGTWQTYMGPKVVIGGSCEQASGNFYWAEYCENPDATYNTSLKRYEISFTGRMSGGSLQIDWKWPGVADPRYQQGTASCSLSQDGTLSCSGFPCGVSGKRK